MTTYTKEQIEKIEEELNPINQEEVYNQMLNDVYPMVNICGYEYEPATALKDVDEIAYNAGLNDYFGTGEYTEINGELYSTDDIERIIEEMQKEND